jgi:hypothetical protein
MLNSSASLPCAHNVALGCTGVGSAVCIPILSFEENAFCSILIPGWPECAGCTREQARKLLAEAGMEPPLLAKPLWADGRDGAHGLAVIHQVTPRLTSFFSRLPMLLSSVHACGLGLTG